MEPNLAPAGTKLEPSYSTVAGQQNAATTRRRFSLSVIWNPNLNSQAQNRSRRKVAFQSNDSGPVTGATAYFCTAMIKAREDY